MASKGYVKLVADITPSLKDALDRKAKRDGMTRRAAIEAAIFAYVREGNKG